VTARGAPKTWQLYVHPAFSKPFDALTGEVERLAAADPRGYVEHPKAKLLRRILDLIETEIPRDPSAAEYALGNTLGPAHRHWRRAKFLGRFRLFFRYSSQARVIIYASVNVRWVNVRWVNDENTLRKAGGRNDPYTVFGALLRKANPPDGWDALMKEATAHKRRRR
jgi:toxin YhaV